MSGPDERAKLTQSLSAETSYAFQHFAERSAIFGLRTDDVELVRLGLVRASAIAPSAIERRDAGNPLGRLYYCLTRCGDDASTAFAQAEQLACDEMAAVLRANGTRLARYPSMDELCKNELVCEVATPHGPGSIQPFVDPYNPTYNLIELSLRVVELLRAEPRYQFDTIQTASSLPTYFIWGRDRNEAERMKPSIVAVSTVQSRLRPEYDNNPSRSHVFAQWLNVYIAEANDPQISQSLAQAAKSVEHQRASMLAVTSGPLVAVVFALNSLATARLTENGSSLKRFCEPLLAVLGGATLLAQHP